MAMESCEWAPFSNKLDDQEVQIEPNSAAPRLLPLVADTQHHQRDEPADDEHPNELDYIEDRRARVQPLTDPVVGQRAERGNERKQREKPEIAAGQHGPPARRRRRHSDDGSGETPYPAVWARRQRYPVRKCLVMYFTQE